MVGSVDFGVLRPSQKATSVVELVNNSNRDLEVKAVSKTCSCTAVLTVDNHMPRNGTLTLSVAYKAPVRPADERRSVYVLFTDDGVPPAVIEVSATVRDEISVSSKVIRLSGSNPATLIAENYSDSLWDKVHVDSGNANLLCSAAMIASESDTANSPRQRWEIKVSQRSGGPPLREVSPLTITAFSSGEQLSKAITVQPAPEDLFHSTPTKLFFGSGRPGTVLTATAVFKFPFSDLPTAGRAIVIQNSADLPLEFDVVPLTDARFKINFQIYTEGPPRLINTNIQVKSQESSEQSYSVPIVARVEKAASVATESLPPVSTP